MVKSLSFIVAASLVLSLPSPAAAEVFSSAYTPLKLSDCKNVTPPEAQEYGGVFRCKGYGGIGVRVAEGDLRMFVSYGAEPASQTAARQTLPQFNTTGETLECWQTACRSQPFSAFIGTPMGPRARFSL
jgi:hypothetical protein